MCLPAGQRLSWNALHRCHLRLARAHLAASRGGDARLHQAVRRHRVVWFEVHETMGSSIRREKSIKRWQRQWKIDLIEGENPTWRDLAEDFGFEPLIKKRWTPDQVRGDEGVADA